MAWPIGQAFFSTQQNKPNIRLIFAFMKITVREYIAHTGMSSQRVGSMIRRGAMPPGILKAEKFGQTYVLYAAKNWKELAQPLERYQRVTKADESAKF